jgi:cytochrome c-type biogenesis protein CcsB
MFETFLLQTNFVVLLLTTFSYWLNALAFLPPNIGFFSPFGVFTALGLQSFFLITRWFYSGHFPLSNLYESVLFLCWVLLSFLSYLVSQMPKTASSFWHQASGLILMPMILFLFMFALWSLPDQLKQTTALVPALQSNWLVMHVTVMIASYGALICACLFAIAYLVLCWFQPNCSWQLEGSSVMPAADMQIDSPKQFKNEPFQALAQWLDNMSYRLVGLGFPLLTIGLLSGSIWANQTWGSYWSWDPKETWSLITWFLFAIYLHTRISRQWNGRQSAILATAGFFIIWICYFGVNLLGKGLHSYGFLNG